MEPQRIETNASETLRASSTRPAALHGVALRCGPVGLACFASRQSKREGSRCRPCPRAIIGVTPSWWGRSNCRTCRMVSSFLAGMPMLECVPESPGRRVAARAATLDGLQPGTLAGFTSERLGGRTSAGAGLRPVGGLRG